MNCATGSDYDLSNPSDVIVVGPFIYDLSKPLGEGVIGKVYKGYRKDTSLLIAAKKICKSSIRKLYILKSILQEVSSLRKVKHENVVQLIDAVQTPDSVYLMMEYCNSGTLRSYLQKQVIIEEEEARFLILQIISGLRELIRHSIIHRDIKPANILLHKEDGVLTCKIGDLGFSKTLSDDCSMEKSMVGTPQYMDPKRLQNEDYTGKKVDTFSIGVIMYEMMFGCPPWRGENYVELCKNVSDQPLLFPSTRRLTPAMKSFLEETLAKEEALRISIDDMYYHSLFRKRFSLT